jgi:hypothetical protein
LVVVVVVAAEVAASDIHDCLYVYNGDGGGGGCRGGYPRLPMSVFVMAEAAAVEVLVVDIHDVSLTDGMSVSVMMAATVDTPDGSVDTVDWFRVVLKMSKHGVSPREGLVTTDSKHDDQLSKVTFQSLVNFLLLKSIRERATSTASYKLYSWYIY